MRAIYAIILAAGFAASTPAAAVTNLIKNGSFEQGAPGTGGFAFWTKSNIPGNAPASIIPYNSTASYPLGAFSEAVTPDDAVSLSPDPVGSQAAYFVGDFSTNETISQLAYLAPGNVRVGFSYYLTQNGLNNVGNSSFQATILGVPIASTVINSTSVGKTWFYASGVGQIVTAGFYDTSFVFNSNRSPSKDIVIDRVFAMRTLDPADVIIPPPVPPQSPNPAPG